MTRMSQEVVDYGKVDKGFIGGDFDVRHELKVEDSWKVS